MKHLVLALAGVIWVCVVTATTLAQQPGEAGAGAAAPQPIANLAQLLSSEAVREDIGFTEQQTEQLKQAFQNYYQRQPQQPNLEGLSEEQRRQRIDQYQREAAQHAEQFGQQLAEILTPEQREQLRQIGFRITAYAAMNNPQVAQQLDLSQEQQQKLQQIRQQTQKEMWQLQDQAAKQSLEVLRAQQLTKLKNLQERGFRQQGPASAPQQTQPTRPQR